MIELLCKDCWKSWRCVVACPEVSAACDRIDRETRGEDVDRYRITVFNRAHEPIAFITFPRENIRNFGDALRWVKRIEVMGGHAIIRPVDVWARV